MVNAEINVGKLSKVQELAVAALQRRYLKMLQLYSPHRLILARTTGAWRFFACFNRKQILTTSSILSNQLVFESDRDLAENVEIAEQLCDYLDKQGLRYNIAWSGNKSIHLELFFDFSDVPYEYHDALRRTLAIYIVEEAGLSKHDIDFTNINWSSWRRGSQLKLYGAPARRGYKTLLTPEALVTLKREGACDIKYPRFPKEAPLNSLPTTCDTLAYPYAYNKVLIIPPCIESKNIHIVESGNLPQDAGIDSITLTQEVDKAIQVLKREPRVWRWYIASREEVLKQPEKRSGRDFLIVKCLLERGFHREVIKSVLSQTSWSKIHERGESYFDYIYAGAFKACLKYAGVINDG